MRTLPDTPRPTTSTTVLPGEAVSSLSGLDSHAAQSLSFVPPPVIVISRSKGLTKISTVDVTFSDVPIV